MHAATCIIESEEDKTVAVEPVVFRFSDTAMLEA